jgi:hypothetical protein
MKSVKPTILVPLELTITKDTMAWQSSCNKTRFDNFEEPLSLHATMAVCTVSFGVTG